ncbi:MAG TPA: hypothetical protein VH854_04590 [Thermoanaerobaculia bacterium]|jgi:hypothetical protein|nr:hypothetical protein [Thermoanaerobaculia bacterium]
MQAIRGHAEENIRFIRDTMERAASFTAVPGVGGMAMGATALAAAALASRQPTADRWLGIWLAEAVVAIAIGTIAMGRKARRTRSDLFSGPARRFLLTLTAPLGAGAILTLVLARSGLTAILPGVWLLLYGTAVVSAGATSVRPVLAMGGCFMLLGAAALASPSGWGDAYLGAGFGGVQIGFGAVIARRHGG